MSENKNNNKNIVPFDAYFDNGFLNCELDSCFKNSPGYVGHELMVPDSGNFITLSHEENSRVLIRNGGEVFLISNLCRHRQATMLEGKGKINSIVCPLHRWTYDLSGNLIGTPHFENISCNPLKKTPLTNCNGLLFENEPNIKSILSKNPFSDFLSFDGFVFNKMSSHICNYNWKTFIEVYLDDYHVESFHSGLGKFVNCNDLSWHFEKEFSVQAVGLSDLKNDTTPIYKKWNSSVINAYPDDLPKFGAIWLLIYPNIMIEWYPKTLVISSLYPISPQKTLNITEFYYSEEVGLFEPDFINNQQNAYNETVLEDDEIAIKIERGRKMLRKEIFFESAPYHSELEAGIPHFYQFLKENCHNLYS